MMIMIMMIMKIIIAENYFTIRHTTYRNIIGVSLFWVVTQYKLVVTDFSERPHGHVLYVKRSISSVDIATRNALDGPGSNAGVGRDFPLPSRPTMGLTHLPIQWVPCLSPG
jgi:hypothetical protein